MFCGVILDLFMGEHKPELTPIACIIECSGYIKKLRKQCVSQMFNREYSPTAKYPFKVMSFVNAMNWRMYETSQGAVKLMKEDLIMPSFCLVRAAWEDMALTYELSQMIKTSCEEQTISENLDDSLMCILFGNRFDKDNRYVGDEHYELFKDYRAKNILTLVQKVEKVFPHTKDYYSTICEFVHPNGDGVCGGYSRLEEETDTTFYGPQFNRESKMSPAFIMTLSCALMLYLQFVESINSNIKVFSKLCEESLKQKDRKAGEWR